MVLFSNPSRDHGNSGEPQLSVIQIGSGFDRGLFRQAEIALETARLTKVLEEAGLHGAKFLNQWDMTLAAINAFAGPAQYRLPEPPGFTGDENNPLSVADPSQDPMLFYHMVHRNLIKTSAGNQQQSAGALPQTDSGVVLFDYREYLHYLSLLQKTSAHMQSISEPESGTVKLCAVKLCARCLFDDYFGGDSTGKIPVLGGFGGMIDILGPRQTAFGYTYSLAMSALRGVSADLPGSETVYLLDPGLEIVPRLEVMKNSALRFTIDESNAFTAGVLRELAAMLGCTNVTVRNRTEGSDEVLQPSGCLVLNYHPGISTEQAAACAELAGRTVTPAFGIVMAIEDSSPHLYGTPSLLERKLLDRGFSVKQRRSDDSITLKPFSETVNPVSLSYIEAHEKLLEYLASPKTVRVNSFLLGGPAKAA